MHFLTAAHCMYGEDKDKILYLSGVPVIPEKFDYEKITFNQKLLFRKISNFEIHENYEDDKYQDDIAIVTVKVPFNFNREYVEKIGLDPINLIPRKGELCEIAGWGDRVPGQISLRSSKNENFFVNHLFYGQVKVIDWIDCNNMLQKYYKDHGLTHDCNNGIPELYPENICAGIGEPDFSDVSTYLLRIIIARVYPCFYHIQGDYGGPLVCKANGTKYLAAIISLSEYCGHPRLPGIYTSIRKYRYWIMKTINKETELDPPLSKKLKVGELHIFDEHKC